MSSEADEEVNVTCKQAVFEALVAEVNRVEPEVEQIDTLWKLYRLLGWMDDLDSVRPLCASLIGRLDQSVQRDLLRRLSDPGSKLLADILNTGRR